MSGYYATFNFLLKLSILYFSDIDEIVIIGRNKYLRDNGKQEIHEILAKKIEIIEITRALQRDVRTIKKAVQNIIF